MTSQKLFNELVLRFNAYADAAVLWVLLKERADVREFKTSAVKMALDYLSGTVQRWDVQRSLERLEQAGFITVRIHRNTGTHVTVNREAVFALLSQPVANNLPGRSSEDFPFLAAFSEYSATREDASQIRRPEDFSDDSKPPTPSATVL